MYAVAHTALALPAQARRPTARLLPLMVAAQATELLWVGLTYAGVEHPSIDAGGSLHLEYLPYSHSLLVGLGGAVLLWATLRRTRWRDLAGVFSVLFASHIVLDIVQHEPNIRLLPWLAHPTIGLNLAASPAADFVVETAFTVVCWAAVRGSRRLLVALVALNLTNLPLMLGGEHASPVMVSNRFVLPTVILLQILMAWGVIAATAGKRGASGEGGREDVPSVAAGVPEGVPSGAS